MAKIQDIDIPHLEFAEAAAPSTPASGIVRIYAKSDGLLYSKDDAGSETLVSGGLAGSGAFVGMVVTNSAVQSIPNITPTALTFNTEEIDTNAYHSTVSNTSRGTVPSGKAGKYRITVHTSHAANNTNDKILFLRKNGSDIVGARDSTFPNASLVGNLNVTRTLALAEGDYIEAFIYQSSGGALNFGGASDGGTSVFEMEFLGT